MTLGRKLFVANVGDSRGIVIKSIQGPVAGTEAAN
jgi:serine/threonine protein phosphatase PrpC